MVFSELTERVLDLMSSNPGPHSVLIAGSGPDKAQDWAKMGFTPVTLDIDPRTEPDIIGSMTALGEIGPYDVIYCCHALEHLYPHEVNRCLAEFKRVLKPGGVAIIVVPDLEDVKPDCKVLPNYPGGVRYCGLHLYYGDATKIEEFPHMAHHCGFIAETLREALNQGGFMLCRAERMGGYNLMGIGINS